MAVASVQNAYKAATSAASVVVPMASALTNGNTVIGTFLITSAASVTSVTDNIGNRWIRAGYSSNAAAGSSEIWYARGVTGGAASVTITYSGTVTAANGISEFSGIYYVDPLDQWVQNYDTSASPTGTVYPRQAGDLFIGAVRTSSSVSATPSGWSSLFSSSVAGVSAQYLVGSGTQSPTWTTSAASPWVATVACFRAGAGGINPNLQFPETVVEICCRSDYRYPLQGLGRWVNISSYVRSFSIGPMGRQHELSRVQSTKADIKVDNRTGVFNPWNTSGFLYNSGYGLRPMNPMSIRSAWNGVNYPQYWGYLQSVTPTISDVLNVDTTLACNDILQMFSLKTLSEMSYEELLLSDPNLQLLYDFGDQIGSFTARDRSGNNYTGSTIDGNPGSPAFGQDNPFLFDTTTCVDLTNGSGSVGGGITTTNYVYQPPLAQNPLSAAQDWTFECWFQWKGAAPVSDQVPNGVLMHFDANLGTGTYEFQVGVKTDANATLGDRFVFTGPNFTSDMRQLIAPTDGNWHHVALVISTPAATQSSGTIYFDGASVGVVQKNAGAAPQVVNLTGITIGSPPPGVKGIDPGGGTQYATPSPINIAYAALYDAQLTAGDIYQRYVMGTWFRTLEFGVASGDASAGRLNKVLQLLGLDPSTMLNVPYPFRTVLFAETNKVGTTSALNYLQTLADTEPGLIFQGPDGMINCYSRQYQYLSTAANTSQATFSDAGASANYRYDGKSLKIESDDLDVWNDIQVQSGRSGAAMQEWDWTDSAAAATSRTRHGARTLQGHTSLKQQYDIDALAQAQNYSSWYVNARDRVTSIVVHSQANGGANIPQMLGRGLLDRITVTYNGQQGGSAFSQESLIESVAHTVDLAGPTWQTTWTLSPYEILFTPTVLDSFKFGASVGATGYGQLTL